MSSSMKTPELIGPRQKKLTIDSLPEDWLFPTTRYRGSKRKILPWIHDSIKDIEYSSVLDLFGGTSVVSILFKRMGKEVTYNDFLKFNQRTGFAFISNNKTHLIESDVEFLMGKHNDITYDNFIQRTFKDFYYLDQENEWLDKIIANINHLRGMYKGKELIEKQAIAIWALGQACLMKRPFNLFHRKNLYIRTNKVERRFGNKTTWEQPFPTLFRHFVKEANSIVFSNKKQNKVINKDAFRVKQKGYDLVYLDPPYFFEGQRDANYRDIYHFLEGVSDYSNWESTIDYSSYNLRLNGHSMKWPEKSEEELTELFEQLVEEFRESKFVISHKSGSVVTVGVLEELLRKIGKTVSKRRKNYKYALSKKNGKPRENIEWLIIGE